MNTIIYHHLTHNNGLHTQPLPHVYKQVKYWRIWTRNTGHQLTALGRILNRSPRGGNGPLIVCNLHYSTRSQLEWTDSCRKSITRSWPVLAKSGQAWASARNSCGTRLLTYRKIMWLTDYSSGNTTQCEYIGSSMEQSWFTRVVLRSRLCGMISVHLIVGPCKGYAWMTLKSS